MTLQQRTSEGKAQAKQDFPVYDFHPELSYLDSAASAQKPRAVLDGMRDFSERSYSNVHRGVHRLSEEASNAYEKSRQQVAQWIGARASDEIVFTSNATMGFNLLAHSLLTLVDEGRGLLVSEMEHHSNYVPWQQACRRSGRAFVVAPCLANGELDMTTYARLLKEEKIGIVAMSHVSNVLGSQPPLKEMIKSAHDCGAMVVVDGCQAISHKRIDVQDLDCDAYVFSSHKVYGPSGVGALYVRKALLEAMPPFLMGGGMVHEVFAQDTTWAPPPMRFEAGTPPIVEAVGLGYALRYLEGLGIDRVEKQLRELGRDLRFALSKMDGVVLYGTQEPSRIKASFNVEGIHPHDLATILDRHHVAVRAGHHCAQPLMRRLGIPACVRASLGVYNDHTDIDRLCEAIVEAQKTMLG